MLSMTGFGRGEAAAPTAQIQLEMKSVNHRFLDVVVRLPREIASLEGVVVAAVKARLRRGRVEVHVARRTAGSGGDVSADVDLFQAYRREVTRLVGDEGGWSDSEITRFALAQPGVLREVPQRVDAELERDALMAACEAALDGMLAMRSREGAALQADLTTHLGVVEALSGEVANVAADVDARQAARLRERLAAFIETEADDRRVVQEAAILADKSDVAEELTRLKSHVVQFREAMDSVEPVGRRLEFLLQEMNREVNTIASKTGDHEVSRAVVGMKTSLERLREQAANVE